MVTRRQRAARFGVELLDAEQVVTVLELATLRVEAPAPNVAALGYDHALSTGCGHDDPSGHRMRFVLQIEDRVFRETTHAAKENLGFSFDQYRAPSRVGVDPGSEVVIQG